MLPLKLITKLRGNNQVDERFVDLNKTFAINNNKVGKSMLDFKNGSFVKLKDVGAQVYSKDIQPLLVDEIGRAHV